MSATPNKMVLKEALEKAISERGQTELEPKKNPTVMPLHAGQREEASKINIAPNITNAPKSPTQDFKPKEIPEDVLKRVLE